MDAELCGNSAGGAATATFTSASKAEVELEEEELVAVVLLAEEETEVAEEVVVEDVLGWNAIMDFSADDEECDLLLEEESGLCLE